MARLHDSPEQGHSLLLSAASFPLTSDNVWYLGMSSESILYNV